MPLQLKVLNQEGKETGEVLTLPESVFGIKPSEHSVYLDVKAFLAAQRLGTHKTKTRAEVSGGGKKPFRQKGTGGARRGSQRSPVLVGGGSAFGPNPRDYRIKVNKKVKLLARKSILSAKFVDGEIIVVEDFGQPEIKTKVFAQTLKKLGVSDMKTLFLTKGKNENLYKSGRNIDGFEIKEVETVSTYDMINCNRLVFQKSAILSLQETLVKN